LAIGDLRTVVGEEGPDRLCHGLGVAMIAHDLSSFAWNEILGARRLRC
jgi:hypothetical protein